jgi:hypothetical protein
MKLEAIGRVSMRNLGLQICRQIDDLDRGEGTFLNTYSASDTETFRDKCDLGGRFDFDAEAAAAHNGAGLLAFLSAYYLLVGIRLRKAKECIHFLGLHLSVLIIAILVNLSDILKIDGGEFGGVVRFRIWNVRAPVGVAEIVYC